MGRMKIIIETKGFDQTTKKRMINCGMKLLSIAEEVVEKINLFQKI
jgi:hypothetical protein